MRRFVLPAALRPLPIAMCLLVVGCSSSDSTVDGAVTSDTATRDLGADSATPDGPTPDGPAPDGTATDGPPAEASPDANVDIGVDIGVDAGADIGTSADQGSGGATVTTFAGSGSAGSLDGQGTSARFDNPANVAVDGSGNIYVADYNNAAIRKITPSGSVSTLTSLPNGITPFGMAFGGDGQLYVQCDWDQAGNTFTGSLWKIDPGSGNSTLLIDNVGHPRGMTPLADGRLVLVDFQQHDVRLLNPQTKAISFLAGDSGQAGFANGQGSNARFDTPHAAIALSATAILVADTNNNRLRKVDLSGNVTTYAGDGTAASTDGSLATARFNNPQGLAKDGVGNIFVSDSGGWLIRRISVGQVSTIAGDGTAGAVDGPALQARFFGLEGIEVTADGKKLYIADGNRGDDGIPPAPYHRIRLLSLP